MNCRFYKYIVVVAFSLTIFSGCAKPSFPVIPTVYTLSPEKQQKHFAQIGRPTATYIPSTKFIKVSIWAPSYLAETLQQAWNNPLTSLFVSESTLADLKFEVGSRNLVSEWVYTVVTSFPATIQDVSINDLQSSWQGQSVGPYIGQPLLMDEGTYEILSAIWGPATANSVNIIAKNELIDYAWAHQPAWAIVPFESLDPRWKVLSVDGISPIHKDFDLGTYPLKIPVSLVGDPYLIELVKKNFSIPSSNRDPGKMTVVSMTGVTALVRATAYTMEQHGMTYPDQDIRQWLQNADITHISNEVPFAENCPEPNPTQTAIRFCSQDSYIELLEDVGTDVVELSGDHFQDWGVDAVFHTLDMYQERGWSYYGGGLDLADGRKSLLLEHNYNRVAFIGCNAKGGSFAQASEVNPGAAACDMEWMANEISRLKQKGYLVIATFQHHEYYSYVAQADQQQDFRQMAEAGAIVVSGSQAHQPQGMEFLDDTFIHYGLGNLFFDQYDLCVACRQGLIDIHVLYDGRYISTELLPIQFVDYARSRPMTADEANNLFNMLFNASGW